MPKPLGSWMKVLVVAEALLFAPFALLLPFGLLFIPLQLVEIEREPLHTPEMVHTMVQMVCGWAGLLALLFVLWKRFRNSAIAQPVPVLLGVALGVVPMAAYALQADPGWRQLAMLILLASAHIVYVSRELLFPIARMSLASWIVVIVTTGVALAVFRLSTHYNVSGNDLLAQQRAWQKARPHAYAFDLQISGWRSPDDLLPRHLEVEGARIIAATYTFTPAPGSTRNYPPAAQSARTIDAVFTDLLTAESQGASIRAHFDQRWHFPLGAMIEPRKADQRWDLKINGFAPLD